MSDPITPWGQVPAGRYEVYSGDDDVIGLTVATTYPSGWAIVRTDPPFMDACDEFAIGQFIAAALTDADTHPVTDRGPDLSELSALSEFAADGEWFASETGEVYNDGADWIAEVAHHDDRVFIAAAVNFVRRLFDRRRELMANAAHRFDNTLRYRTDGHEMQRQLTPPYVLEPVRSALGGTIALDPCTEPDNPTGAVSFFTADNDGAGEPWDAPTIYVNPPYSKARERWVERCIEAARTGARVVLLIPAATDTRIFQRALGTASSVVFIKGRVKFGVLRKNRRQEAASHPSALIGWNVSLAPCSHLGHVVDLTSAVDRLLADRGNS